MVEYLEKLARNWNMKIAEVEAYTFPSIELSPIKAVAFVDMNPKEYLEEHAKHPYVCQVKVHSHDPLSEVELAAISLYVEGELSLTLAGEEFWLRRTNPITRLFRKRQVKKMAGSWKGVYAVQSSDPKKTEMVNDIYEQWSRLDGSEIDLYKQLRDYSKAHGYKPAERFYGFLIHQLKRRNWFFEGYPPFAWFGQRRERPKGFLVPIKKEWS